MKKLIICSLLSVIVIGCDDATPKVTSDTGYEFSVIEIDGCEYLIRKYGHRCYFSHKGNCKYCIERNGKLKDE